MKYKGTLIAVCNMEKSKAFYRNVLGLRVIDDFGANVSLTGGIFLQTIPSWKKFIDRNVFFGANNCELYFEEDKFDDFIDKLNKSNVTFVHKQKEQEWGQRVVRFYDPDRHLIEVGEPLKSVILRFYNSGMNVAEISIRMDIPLKMVERNLK